MSKRSGCKTFLGVVAALGLSVLGATNAHAGFTTVNPPFPGEDTHQQVLETVYGPGASFTRVDDDFDQTFTGDIVSARAIARFADFSQTLAVKSGGTTTDLFTVTGEAYAVGGSSGALDLPDGPYEFIRKGTGQTFSSKPSENSDGEDHLVTYLISGNGIGEGTYALFWEDLAKGQKNADFDFEDMIVEVRGATPVIIPLPAAAWSGLATLAAGALLTGYRRMRNRVA